MAVSNASEERNMPECLVYMTHRGRGCEECVIEEESMKCLRERKTGKGNKENLKVGTLQTVWFQTGRSEPTVEEKKIGRRDPKELRNKDGETNAVNTN
ncbi:hypothetical protein WN48_06679 [Eufriesea mexicana]|uniref:Uncharacterized protein n=1 Tax=Eufriesea mexicana TaxID=516756 RepID=A0A310SBR2_9HYME|nr:hypothetical protein WN48_06679 [Eufriesea mexicana]